jgi:hypothetical protein
MALPRPLFGPRESQRPNSHILILNLWNLCNLWFIPSNLLPGGMPG